MTHIAPRPLAAALLSLFLTLCATSCIAPLAPGYQILKESREVRFTPGGTPELQIHSTYTILNSGTTTLSFIDVVFPDEKLYGRKNLRVQLDGRDVAPAELPGSTARNRPKPSASPSTLPGNANKNAT